MVSLPVLSCICMADRGVVYLAVQQFGYLEAALISALALRALHPHLPITVVSDLSALAEVPLDRHDQLALARAIAASHTSVLELPRRYNLSPRDAEPLLKQGESANLLHCWGGKVTSGRFRRLARRFCPQALETAEQLLSTIAEPLLRA
jgi:hypothetical protein